MCLCGGSEDREHRCELLAEVSLMTNSWNELSLLLLHQPPLALQAILEAAQQKAQGSNQKIVVTGCLAQRYSAELAGKHIHAGPCCGQVHLQSFTVTCCCAEQIPEADLVMGFQSYGNLTSSLQGLLGMEQSGADSHPAKRARVQVGLLLWTLHAPDTSAAATAWPAAPRCLCRWGMQPSPSGPSWRGTASRPGTLPT